jgi:seryl-tRNA synthetase
MNFEELLATYLIKKEIGTVIFESPINDNNCIEFNYNEFIEINTFQFEDGLTIYNENICKLINEFRSYFDNNNVFKDFKEMAFPRLLSEEVANNFGLIELWPYYLLKTSAFNDKNYTPTISKDKIYILDPVQCAWFYKIISEYFYKLKFPFKVKESLGGWSYRNETKSSLCPLEKDITFLRTEFVFAGLKEDVIGIRTELISEFCKFLEQLEIPYRLAIGNGCYDSMPQDFNKMLTNATRLCDLPVIDVEVFLPFKDSWLEIAGASYFGNGKVNRFTNKLPDIESGCFGVGLSRLALAFFANNGMYSNLNTL